MKHILSISIIFAISASGAFAQAPTTGFCIENQDDRAAVFVVDASPAYRNIATLAPKERLCTLEFSTPQNGFVSIFYDEDAIEGCSRLAAAGDVQVLLKYHDFDNCEWQISQ